MTMRHLLAIACTSGCLFGPLPPRPTYDEQTCRPSHDDFEVLARSERDWTALRHIDTDPGVALAQAYDECARRGLKLRKKRADDSQAWDGFSTTLPGTILLASDWDEKPIEQRAAILWHELVHDSQYRRLGSATFLAYYAIPEGRWALEVPAYALMFRVQQRIGASDKVLALSIADRAEFMYKSYRLSPMPACTKDKSAQIWLAAIGLR